MVGLRAAVETSGEARRGAGAVGVTAGANNFRSLARGETSGGTPAAGRTKDFSFLPFSLFLFFSFFLDEPKTFDATASTKITDLSYFSDNYPSRLRNVPLP